MKTNKSYTKRLRVTKRGKIVARKPGQDHFNAKESGAGKLAKKRSKLLKLNSKTKKQFLLK